MTITPHPQTGPTKALLIGASGFLGSHLIEINDPRFELIPASHRRSRVCIDITSRSSVRSALENTRPNIVILTAALADIDRCERETQLANAINIEGARNVAEECGCHEIRLIFTSSGAVFDGSMEHYTEDASPAPVNLYGKTKMAAEQIVQASAPGAIIVRLSLVLGFSATQDTNSLFNKLLASFTSDTPVPVSAREYRNAIDARTAATWILDLAASPDAQGMFHLGSSDSLSRSEIVRHAALMMGFPNARLVPGEATPGRAPRGLHEYLVPERIASFSSTSIPSCLQAIERCFHSAPQNSL